MSGHPSRAICSLLPFTTCTIPIRKQPYTLMTRIGPKCLLVTQVCLRIIGLPSVRGNVNRHVEEEPGTPRETRTHRHYSTHAAPGARIAMASHDTTANSLISEVLC